MFLSSVLRVTLVSVFLFTSVDGHCVNPKVRKEWRDLCADERAAWINAVKVFILFNEVVWTLAQTAPVSCQDAALSKYRSHRRHCDFIDPTYNSKQFCLRR